MLEMLHSQCDFFSYFLNLLLFTFFVGQIGLSYCSKLGLLYFHFVGILYGKMSRMTKNPTSDLHIFSSRTFCAWGGGGGVLIQVQKPVKEQARTRLGHVNQWPQIILPVYLKPLQNTLISCRNNNTGICGLQRCALYIFLLFTNYIFYLFIYLTLSETIVTKTRSRDKCKGVVKRLKPPPGLWWTFCF